MEKFVEESKLSKKERAALNKAKRSDWGAMSPVTRKVESRKAYNRARAKRQTQQED